MLRVGAGSAVGAEGAMMLVGEAALSFVFSRFEFCGSSRWTRSDNRPARSVDISMPSRTQKTELCKAER